MDYLMGIDLGTSRVKSMLIDTGGKTVGFGAVEYGIDSPRPGFAEQPPDTWWRAAAAAVSKALAAASGAGVAPGEIRGIGMSGQMHGLVALDRAGLPVRPAVIWADQRSGAQVGRMNEQLGRDTLARVMRNRAATGFFLPSLLWIMENEPDVYSRIAKAVLPKDFIRLRLCGELSTEVTDASATLAFDVAGQRWAVEPVERMGVDSGLLPFCRNPVDRCGGVTKEAASLTGLSEGTPVFAGGGDQPMQAVGSGVISEGTVSLNIGTAGQLSTPVSAPSTDRLLRTHTFCHAPRDTWYIMGAILNGGLALGWIAERVLGEPDFGRLDAEAASVGPVPQGLVFLPYLVGERTPHFDPRARGVFFGLGLRHEKGHLVRAVMEGVVFALRDSLEIMRSLGVEVDSVTASGGGASSSLWRQIQADILNVPVRRSVVDEQACMGAALTAGVGAGVFSTYGEACAQTVRPSSETVEPYPDRVSRYEEGYRIYREIYPRSRHLFGGSPEETAADNGAAASGAAGQEVGS